MSLKNNRLLLYAPNVHTGGGFVLLKSILRSWPKDSSLVAWLDFRARDTLELPANAQVEWVSPTIGSRLKSELALFQRGSVDDRILCFHGLPPLLKNNASVLIFQQNRNYLGLVPIKIFSWRTRQRLRFEQTFAYLFRHSCSNYFVQTYSMARDLKQWLGEKKIPIHILPFIDSNAPVLKNAQTIWDFLYVADGEAHKNHRNLIEAWIVLAKQGLKPSLGLTLTNRDSSLLSWIEQQKNKHDLRIINLGHLSHDKLTSVYCETNAIVFPSISESFGLPLIEARNAGLPIVASELDFVRDVCEPIQSFNPYSPLSIARAIRRHIGRPDSIMQPFSASDFLRTVMGPLDSDSDI